MALVLIPAKGCVIRINRGDGQPLFALDPELRGYEDAPIVIDGPDISLQENVFTAATLDDKQFLYTFGSDFGNAAVTGRVLLGRSVSRRNALQPLISYYESNRIGARKLPIGMTLPGDAARKFALTALTISRPDPEFHTVVYAFRGTFVNPPA